MVRNHVRQIPGSINELLDQYQVWAEKYYCNPLSRQSTGEAKQMRYAVVSLRQVAGEESLASMSAEVLYDCQDAMIESGLSRKVVNARINRIRRVWRWAAQPPQRWVPTAIYEDLRLVDPLKYGRGGARECKDIKPVDESIWRQTLSAVALDGMGTDRGQWSMQLTTMLELHWYTGMRPGELCSMKKSELTDIGDLIIYQPLEHKTRHHGTDRIIVIGEMGQSVLRPWLKRVEGDQIFGYLRSSYRNVIRRVNKRHNIPQWSPNQIQIGRAHV